jgi:hypothetical protein
MELRFVSGSWAIFEPPESLGEFGCDIMLLLTDGSVLIHNAYQNQTANWSRLTPDEKGNYLNGSWSPPLPMANSRLYFSSGILMDGRAYVIGGVCHAGERYATW